ncbi:OpgC family protein [Taklimakanibacter deserti]|uniref:OpgC family protein n=1 Tax=Taklimakanibacter deserti TaxID=2267839 RepID=UPI000E648467
MTAAQTPSRRDHRVDFLRGLALAIIFINHVPGNFYEKLTPKNFGFSDAAEIFVLLAGFASAYAYFSRFERGEFWDATAKAWRRAGVLYVSHVVTSVIGIALFCFAALYFMNPGYLDDTIVYMDIKPLMDDPVKGFIGLVSLGHQLGYFNILPMYMALLLMLPIMMVLGRLSLSLLLAVSVTLWLLTGIFAFDLPNYPMPGGWFFNPFAWQLLFVIGFILGQRQREAKPMPFSPWLYGLAALYVVLAYWWVPFDWLINFSGIGNYLPATIWSFDKGFVAWPRLLHVLALGYVVMMSPLGRLMHQIPKTSFLTAMGRHSLPVFCVGSLLSMTGAVIHHEWGGSFAHDTLIVATGLAVMGLLAVFLDGRKPAPPKPLQVPQTAAT